MKKIIYFLLIFAAAFSLYACGFTKETNRYKVNIDAKYASICNIKSFYKEGEAVVIKLPKKPEHTYILHQNGVRVLPDLLSDEKYTYFIFTMPNNDVNVVIDDFYAKSLL